MAKNKDGDARYEIKTKIPDTELFFPRFFDTMG